MFFTVMSKYIGFQLTKLANIYQIGTYKMAKFD